MTGPLGVLRRLSAFVYKRVAPIAYARSIGVTVGQDCRLINVSFSSEPYLIRIGNHVSATAARFETHDGGVWVLRDRFPELDLVRGITVGNNVFIGYGAILMPGVTIGNNVVIGAGAVVTRDIPDNSVAVGIPARVVKSVQDYEAKVVAAGDRTKLMTDRQKRAHYLGLGR